MNTDSYNGFSDEIIIYSSGILLNLLTLILSNGIIYEISLLMLTINILPIYPFDGYNILESIVSYFIPYKYSIIICSIINIIIVLMAIVMLFIHLDLLMIINLGYLLYLPIYKIINIDKLYNAFILNKVINKKNLKVKMVKFDENISDRLFKYHTINTKIGDNLIFENDLINLKYKYY